MTELVTVKGLKGKQNKKKWRKNIDVTALLDAHAQQHTREHRAQFNTSIEVEDQLTARQPLDPKRFQLKPNTTQKPKYNNQIVRNHSLDQVEDTWSGLFEGKSKYKATQIPSVILPESGHSYNPRQADVEKLKERIVDYQQIRPIARKIKAKKELPEVAVRHRNKNKRIAQLQEKARTQQKQFNRELNRIKTTGADLEIKEQKIQEGIKTKQIAKDKNRAEALAGRVRKGPKLSKKHYMFKEYLPEGEPVRQVSKVELKDELFRDRFDSIFRRGVFEARNVKVHANRQKNIKVVQRAFIE